MFLNDDVSGMKYFADFTHSYNLIILRIQSPFQK